MQMGPIRAMPRVPQHLQARVLCQPRLAKRRLWQRVVRRPNKVRGAALPAWWCNCMCMVVQVCKTTSARCLLCQVLGIPNKFHSILFLSKVVQTGLQEALPSLQQRLRHPPLRASLPAGAQRRARMSR